MQTNENKDITKDFTNVERGEWNADELNEQATNLPSDEIQRQMLRGDESQGDADARDVVGGVASKDTAHGRKEIKRGDES